MENILSMLKITNFSYGVWIEKESYYPTQMQIEYSMSMSIEGVTITTECTMQMTMKDFGAFDTITAPEEARENAISMDELQAGPDF